MKKWYVLGLFFSLILTVVYPATIPQATYAAKKKAGDKIGTAAVRLTNCTPKDRPTLCSIKIFVNVKFNDKAKFPRNIEYAAYLTDRADTLGIFYGSVRGKPNEETGVFKGENVLDRMELATLNPSGKWRVCIFTTKGEKGNNPIIPENLIALGDLKDIKQEGKKGSTQVRLI